jgi:hypothetical protein
MRYRGVVEKIGQFAAVLKRREPRRLLRGVARIARQRPLLVLGGALGAGSMAIAFLKRRAFAFRSSPGAARSALDHAPVMPPEKQAGLGLAVDDATLDATTTAPDGYGPAPGGYGPASSPAGAHGGAGTFGSEGAGGGTNAGSSDDASS